ncbi:MAG: replication protein C [Rhodobacteraceae bacterium]|nr:replication protein C [Paracoccaceae bacterium]
MKHTGWRKPTPGLVAAQTHAQAGEGLGVPKGQAIVAVKRVGPYIGLKPADLVMLDILGAYTRPQDWDAGRRPVVWASNTCLMERTGFSLSTVKRHTRRLAEAGVITFADSPNGKRWGYRDGDGHIVEAYGFDLSPMAARAQEFMALHAEMEAQRDLCRRLRRQITIARRTIRAALDTTVGAAEDDVLNQYDALIQDLPARTAPASRLEQILHAFNDLRDKVLVVIGAAGQAAHNSRTSHEKASELTPRETETDTHIQVTNDSQSVKESGCAQTAEHQPDRQATALSLNTILAASPEFTSWCEHVGRPPASWPDLLRAVTDLGPMIGIKQTLWSKTETLLGQKKALAALVLVFEKYCRGEIRSPGGYLQGMIRKAGAGALNLDRSYHGRLVLMNA